MEKKHQRQASISSVLNATIYEASVISGLRIVFWNDSRGISISSIYTDMKTSSRSFTLETDPDAIKMAQKILKKNGWESLSSQFSTAFQEIQIDVLFHVHIDEDRIYEFKENVKLFNARPEPVKGLLRRKISRSQITANDEPEANSYLVVEITMDENRFIEKLQQVERDLTVLLCRKRLETKEYDVSIEELVSYAGIATNHLDMRQCHQFIEDHPRQLPLVYRLFQMGRFFYFKHAQDIKDIVYQVSRHSAVLEQYAKSNSDVQSVRKELDKAQNEVARLERELLELKVLQKKQQVENERMDSEQERLMKLYKFLIENEFAKEAKQVMNRLLQLSNIKSEVE
jgi:hypothetical protein